MKDKYSFILGGTKGLGLSLAWESHNRGIRPIIAGRSALDPETMKAFPPSALCRRIDLTDPATLKEMDTVRRLDIRYFFWNAGKWMKKSFRHMSDDNIDLMIDVHLRGPLKILRRFLSERKDPCHIVIIASTSWWTLRNREQVYCAVKGAKATFARNIALELWEEFPGSHVVLVNPGGMKTGLFTDGRDTSTYMEPDAVAKIIWEETEKLGKNAIPFVEVDILRNEDGTPRVEYGPKTPQILR